MKKEMEFHHLYSPKNKEVKFIGSDTKKLFNKNLITQGSWIYNSKHIRYKYNEQGFRNKSFNNVNWSDSIVVIGCSHVEGVGLAVEDTLCYQLEKMLNTPVINLGVGSSAIDLACWNSLKLHNYYPRPKALVHIWSSPNRYTDRRDKRLLSFMPMYEEYNYTMDWSYRSDYYIKTDRALWKGKTTYVEATFFEDEHMQHDLIRLKHIDKARDLMHPGIKSNYIAAEKIAEQILKT